MPLLSVAIHSITAFTNGDALFDHTSAVLSQTIIKADTTPPLGIRQSLCIGQTVTFTATISPVFTGSRTRTGTCHLYGRWHAQHRLRSMALDKRTLAVSSLAWHHTIKAAYAGTLISMAATARLRRGSNVNQANTLLPSAHRPTPPFFRPVCDIMLRYSRSTGSGIPGRHDCLHIDGIHRHPSR